MEEKELGGWVEIAREGEGRLWECGVLETKGGEDFKEWLPDRMWDWVKWGQENVQWKWDNMWYIVLIDKSSISEMMESKSNQNEFRQKLKIAKERNQESISALKSFAQEGD